jgi:hypothetical protein
MSEQQPPVDGTSGFLRGKAPGIRRVAGKFKGASAARDKGEDADRLLEMAQENPALLIMAVRAGIMSPDPAIRERTAGIVTGLLARGGISPEVTASLMEEKAKAKSKPKKGPKSPRA